MLSTDLTAIWAWTGEPPSFTGDGLVPDVNTRVSYSAIEALRQWKVEEMDKL